MEKQTRKGLEKTLVAFLYKQITSCIFMLLFARDCIFFLHQLTRLFLEQNVNSICKKEKEKKKQKQKNIIV